MSENAHSQDRRAQAEAVLAALNRRDFAALAERGLHPDMEFRSAFAVAEGGTYRGLQGLREWATTVDSAFDDFRSELIDFREVDDERAVVVLRNTGKAAASHIPIDVRSGQVWTWREGLMWRNDVYRYVHEAFAAVGLPE
jgi:ketosteroid isomerase-like protein